ncbi:MAG: UDP-3-O-(3-hydroxymyristoyl)glucosamine N-acyltransferase [Pseudomonadota bacterium]
MADPRFFKRSGPFTLHELAELSGAELHEAADAELKIEDVAPLDQAEEKHITFLDNVRYKNQLGETQAAACVLDAKMVDNAPEGLNLLISPNPYKSYALIAQAFYPQTQDKGHISPHAMIDPTADIHETATIEAGAVIGPSVVIGAHTIVRANATISHALIGDHVHIYPGACIGQDGFGFAIDPARHVKVPQLGRVIIGDHVEVGSNTTIDRGAGPDTVIGAGTWIDNQVQIAHNVKIGKGCVLVAQCGIAGSTVLDDYVVVAAKVGVAGHLHIGTGAKIGAMSGVMRDVGPGEEVLGQPAIPSKEFMRQIATIKKLSKKQ